MQLTTALNNGNDNFINMCIMQQTYTK